MTMNFLGLDIGTSAVKAVLVDENETVLASASVPLALSRPKPLWSEQDPGDWWSGVAAATRAVSRAAPMAWRDIAAIGLSGQMHGPVLLDAGNTIIRPAILWNDGRAEQEARSLAEQIEDIGRLAGIKPMAGFAAPKLLWLKAHEPEAFQRVAMVLMPKDYVRWRLTGEFATDMCDASGTLWLDVARHRWSEKIVAACGLTPAQLPRLMEGNAISGTLTRDIAEAWGLRAGIPVAAGAGDAAAAAIGIGAVNDGDALISLGTSAQYFVAGAHYKPAPEQLIHAFCHGVPERWFQMAALLNGASSLAWAAQLFGMADVAALLDEAEADFTVPSDLLFLPYLTGERTPLDNPKARGVMFGLSAGSTRSAITQAVLEGVALSLADCQEKLALAGAKVDRLGVTGGGARSRHWLRLIAAILNKPLVLYAGAESGPAFGAARLARAALTSEDPLHLCRAPPVAASIAPEEALVDAYAGRLARFRGLYGALKPVFA